MKRPSLYQQHEDTLKHFTDIFNNTKDGIPLVMQVYHTENFRDDGVIVNTKTGKRVAFDWEYRDRYFKSGIFRFKTLGQFERKIKKAEIGLSMQSDSDETAILIAWHQDFKREKEQKVTLKTDHNYREYGSVRYTNKFKIYKHIEITEFKRMVFRALKTDAYDHTVFE